MRLMSNTNRTKHKAPSPLLASILASISSTGVIVRSTLLVALLVMAPHLCGCTIVSYAVEAGCGQLAISLGARPIEDAIADRDTPPRTAALLAQVGSVKRFGERHGLRPTNSYRKYVDVDRGAAVWVVTASEPLRFRMKTWSFPIVGSVTYLGWFNKAEAELFASDLESDGWDVDLRGAGAYSTLGWFDDPVLSTMLSRGPDALGELANVVIHESVHATVYFAGQTAFNESIASFIGDALAKVYLDENAGPESPEKEAYLEGERAGERRRKVMHAAYIRLEALYASKAPKADKLAQKKRIMAALEAEVGARRPFTNATLAQFKTYNSSKGELDSLLSACGGSFPRMVSALKSIPPEAFKGTQDRNLSQLIDPLIRGGCPAR